MIHTVEPVQLHPYLIAHPADLHSFGLHQAGSHIRMLAPTTLHIVHHFWLCAIKKDIL